MMSRYAIALLALSVPTAVLAQDDGKYRCTYGDLTRRVEILTEPGVTVPCEVHYYKDSEAAGEKQVLWSAQSQAGYCQQKTAAFIAKLEGWGWDCGGDAAAAPAGAAAMPEVDEAEEADEALDEEPVRDDTDVLSPGDASDG